MIYADNAATSAYKPKGVIDAVLEALANPGNAGRGSHDSALKASRGIYQARERVNDFFDGYGPEQTVFTSGITESLNIAIKGLLKPGDHAITTWAEHNSVLRPLYEMEEQGVSLSITDPEPEAIREQITDRTKAVVMTHGSNVTGEMFAIAEVGDMCRSRGILFVVDTAQTAGYAPVSMKEMGMDVLCFTGHKGLSGPQGTGGLCVRKGIDIEPFKTGGSGIHSFDRKHPSKMPVRLEAGTLNTPGILGLAAGISFLQETGVERIREKEAALAKEFYEQVSQIPSVKCYGKPFDARRHTPTISLNIGERKASAVSDRLAIVYEIATRAGAHCAPLVHEHFGTRNQGMVRFSFGYKNTQEDVAACIQAVREIAGDEW